MRYLGRPDPALLLVLLSGVAVTIAQFEDDFGPAPPRLLIPGAVSLGPAQRRPPSRLRSRPLEQDFEPAPRPRVRPSARRLPIGPPQQPLGPPSPQVSQFFAPAPVVLQQRPLIQQQQEVVRPVSEDSEDDYGENLSSPSLPSYSPSPSPTTPPPPPPPPPQRPSTFRPERPAFRPERPLLLPTPLPELNYVSPSRPQLRPTLRVEEEEEEEEEEENVEPRRKPTYNRADQAFTLRNKARPTPTTEEPQYSRQAQTQYTRAQNVVRAPQKQTYSSAKQDDYEKPLRPQRTRKPVAQVLRRYRNDNEDGSITWGFENDDGSFKEETIGTDCVTYGKYGYVDPDGNRREYSYSTGVLCDKDKRADSEEQPSEGYIDYAENKYVLPNGDSIDLNKMVKNRARKPVSASKQYRN